MTISELCRNALIVALIIGAAGATGVVAYARPQNPSPSQNVSSDAASKSDTIPVTTHSAEARSLYEEGLHEEFDLLYVDPGIDKIRQAVKADPRFAQAHAMLAFVTTNPAEGEHHRALARQYVQAAAPDERLLIRFLNGTKDGRVVPAIAAMNDLFARYPNDNRFITIAATWLCSNEQEYDRGAAVLERVLKNDPSYGPALNNIAYCYAFAGRGQLSPAFMQRYVDALPGEPNPLDSYGEILRMLGDFKGALAHFEISNKMVPGFSQIGISYHLRPDGRRRARPRRI